MRRTAVPAVAALVLALLAPALTRASSVPARFTASLDAPLEGGEQLVPSGLEGEETRFGTGVAVSADGSTALVGAPGDGGMLGSVFAFTHSGEGWTQQGPKLSVAEPASEVEAALCHEEPGECGAGAGVALSANGDIALIGAPRQNGGAGRAWVFTRFGSTWTKLEALTGGPEESGEGRLGRSVSLSADGSTALVGAPGDAGNKGAAWIFARTPAGFVRQGPKLVATENGTEEARFGRSVSLSADGSTALVGGPAAAAGVGSAVVFARSGDEWAQQGPKLTGPGESGAGRFGFSVSLSADGSTALIGARNDEAGVGAAWPFVRTGTSWAAQGPKLTGPGESRLGEFGFSVSLAATGNVALIGGPRDALGLHGAAWVFGRAGGVWSAAEGKLTAPEAGTSAYFGSAVAISSNEGVALIGAPRSGGGTGSAWSFLGRPVEPPQVRAVTPASGPVAGGTAVTIEGHGFTVGAEVTIDGVPASEVTLLSATELTAVTGSAPPGSGEVIVSDLYGSSPTGPKFTYLAPPEPPAEEEHKEEHKEAPEEKHEEVPAPKGGVLGTSTTELPTPTLAVDGNLIPVSGLVRVKLPGKHSFSVLATGAQVPFGTLVDATTGKVTVKTSGAHGEPQTGTFYGGEFVLTQSRNGTAQGTLTGGSFSSCPSRKKHRHHRRKSSADTAKRKKVRKLWAEAHGSYSTKGNYATGAALGTRWLTEDVCGGTLIVVASHRVRVTDLVKHRSFLIDAGHSYFARAR